MGVVGAVKIDTNEIWDENVKVKRKKAVAAPTKEAIKLKVIHGVITQNDV